MASTRFKKCLPYYYIIVLIKIIFISFFFNSCQPNPRIGYPLANIGLLDLSGWNFNQKSEVPLNGDWEFYWNELYSEEKLANRSPENPQHYLFVPGVWNYKKPINDEIGGEGFATLRLQILLPPTEKDLAIRIPENFYSVHAIWINGIKKEWNGIPGRNPESTNFVEHDIGEYIVLDSRSVDLIIEIANFRGNTRWGGIRNPFYIMKINTLKSKIMRKHFYTFFIFSCILSIGVYHLSFFKNYSKDKLPLYFSIFCFIVSSYSLVTSTSWIIIMPKMGPNSLFQAEFILELLLTPTCFLFISYIFPKDLSKTVFRILMAIVSLFLIGIMIYPINKISSYYGYSLYIPIIFGTYILAMMIKAFVLKRKFSGLILFSITVLFIFMINDVLHGLINFLFLFPYSFPLGLLIFICIHSHIIAVRQAEAYSNAESLVVLQNKYNDQIRRQAEERSRIARDIHDSIGSEITAMMTQVRLDGDNPDTILAKVKTQLNYVLINIRDIVYLLGQEKKEYEILEGEILKYIERLKTTNRFIIHSNIEKVSQSLGMEKSLSTQRIFLEMMTNIIRHAKATEISIHLRKRPHRITLIVVNNGIPFAWNELDSSPSSVGIESIMLRSQKMSAKVQFFHKKGLNFGLLNIPVL
ncbi:sensor histidine kinase [Leptospira sp. GIMC2001]|uniref:sensor histidine kinase n=1 Tax=Leptospira sp. GIMC2001 TaxID=1513297 RepID=UPI0023493340|nr:7TM diverse intracellular signaling domain-containing protein [Leptospira sp. GIMC2001]WCL49677.1 histidine kinase [Leptospira sp. GIMC2001]